MARTQKLLGGPAAQDGVKKGHRPSFGPVRPPHTQGIDLLERALHQLDLEASKYLSDLPEELLVRVAQVEHCYVVLHEAMMRHLPSEVRDYFPAPDRDFGSALDKFKRDHGYDVG